MRGRGPIGYPARQRRRSELGQAGQYQARPASDPRSPDVAITRALVLDPMIAVEGLKQSDTTSGWQNRHTPEPGPQPQRFVKVVEQTNPNSVESLAVVPITLNTRHALSRNRGRGPGRF